MKISVLDLSLTITHRVAWTGYQTSLGFSSLLHEIRTLVPMSSEVLTALTPMIIL